MKLQFKNTPIALAVAAMFLSPVAFASDDDNGDGGGNYHDPVSITKDISVTQDVTTEGSVNVDGDIYINASSMAVVDDKQINGNNEVMNNEVTNSATLNGDALNGASGNIGVNISAGDNNQQANAAAFSAADASFVFGSSDAEVFATQAVEGNTVTNMGNTNAATLGGDALANASGNIGVNISAGNSNQQKNDLAASVAVARMATATVQANQLNGNNNTTNNPTSHQDVSNAAVDLAFNATGVSAGIVDQNGDQYLDTWDGNTHPGGAQTGHIDVDSAVQGASNRPVSSGLDANGNPNGDLSNGGGLSFNEQSDIALSGSITGSIPVVVAVNMATTNTASLGDGALAGASGNIGVNIASGTNNQQFNGLAISATHAGAGTGGGTGGE